MSYFINNQQKINGIIFEKRNKNYGAYQLRSDYGYTLLFAVSSAMIGIVSMSLIAYYFSNHPNNLKPDYSGQLLYKDSLYVIPYNHQEPEETKQESKKEITQKPLVNNKSELNVNTIILDSLKNELATELSQSTATSEITNTTSFNSASSNSEVLQGEIVEENTVKAHSVKKDFEVDTPPEFEGGLKALYNFIAKNTKYPIDAIEAGQEGIVRVNFVVDEKGQVGQLTLLNKKGFGLDEEALRVVALLPKFKSPAKIKGEAVKVSIQLPIKFLLR